ncbi:type II toxin-antitoxin system RelE/ParE family toxin [Flavobacterium sp.]|uniref:type II toxin-antitoxin system RelE/ParE family toxin n=1 Tax=Flavobacterium sp. TaxID=239 RepID=UPI0026146135|nr:type II toxin-antitoxin system RelE/ParE family toxin [Flavobacterium sp.]MDG2432007.1 type II toxin-antitoxin system RelE/ParE family toxin [Flavobacterium sp.]
MANYIFTNKAVEDLTQIWDYTYEVWSESQADKYYKEILEHCRYIAENHNSGKNYHEISTEIFGYKSGQHILFYRIVNPTQIEITRILHSRMDLKNRMQQ